MDEKIQELCGLKPISIEEAKKLLTETNGNVEKAAELFSQRKKEKEKEKESGKKIATLSTSQHEESSDDGEDDGQEFFAGGKATGVAIKGPTKNSKELVGGILKKAEKGGKQDLEEMEKSKKQKKSFSGKAYRLGTENEESTVEMEDQEEEEEAETIQTTLIFWQDGFSIDDGPLRPYTDPKNAEFLDYVKKGKIPPEMKAKHGQEVRVLVSNKTEEKYVAPKKILKPFSGSGQRLGSIVPGDETSSQASSSNQIIDPQPSQPSQPSQQPSQQPSSSGPTTSIQIRLSDGTRMVMKIALDAKISEIRRFINMSRPGAQNFSLMTTFPNVEIENEELTIEEAKLANSVVVQKKK